MTKFIFFRGFIGTIDLLDGTTYATASIYNPNTYWTPEESERLRTERMRIANEFDGIISHEQYMLNRDRMIEEERLRSERLIQHSRETDEQIRLFQATSTITVNPSLWTKVKIFGIQVKLFFKECWRYQPIGLIYITILMCVIGFIFIAKIFGL